MAGAFFDGVALGAFSLKDLLSGLWITGWSLLECRHFFLLSSLGTQKIFKHRMMIARVSTAFNKRREQEPDLEFKREKGEG